MATPSEPWPCPVCAELIPVGANACPSCGAPPGWIDLLRALDYTIRNFHLWSVVGRLTPEQYKAIVAACRQRRDEMARAAQGGQPAPHESGLPAQGECWNCRAPYQPAARYCSACGAALAAPEVRLFRYQTFLCQEIRGHERGGRLSPQQAGQLAVEMTESLANLRGRLEKAALHS